MDCQVGEEENVQRILFINFDKEDSDEIMSLKAIFNLSAHLSDFFSSQW